MSIKSSLSVLLLLSAQSLLCRAQQADRNFYARPGVTAAQIIRARGFLAEEYFITTQDGYVLKLTRGMHPKINGGNGSLPNRVPILFVHGLVVDSTIFLINSFDAEPKDLSKYNLTANPSGFANEPSARSLPFLAMNFGHEVWLLSRRGVPGSQRKVGNPNSIDPNATRSWSDSAVNLDNFTWTNPTPVGRFSPQTFSTAPAAFANYGQFPQLIKFSFDANYWNYSYDEQAQYDFPQSMKYVLNYTGRETLSVVAHSAGGAIGLMSLSLYPELAANISSAILWAPSFGQGQGDSTGLLVLTEPIFVSYIGSFPPAFSSVPLQAALGLVCATGLTQRTLCESVADVLLGLSGGREPIYPEFINAGVLPAASHEYAQLLQAARLGGLMHKFDHGPAGNQAAYGQLVPPSYNASNIALRRMSFYAGLTDSLVTPADVAAVLQQLTVPYKSTLIPTTFNHGGHFFHDDAPSLVIIPSLVDIQSSNWTTHAGTVVDLG